NVNQAKHLGITSTISTESLQVRQCFTTASEWYFILFTSDGISSTSKDPLNIRFSEFALKEGSEKEKDLRKNVKRVMEVIVGLLKNRLECVDEEPDRKRVR
ncbi:15178_t:CDS:1, partial [Funneliformis caledonium]